MEFKEAKEQFCGIYYSLIKRMYPRVSPQFRDELCQKGDIAIWKALETFDESKGVKLSTHVYNTIYYDLNDYRCEEHGLTISKFRTLMRNNTMPTFNSFDKLDFLTALGFNQNFDYQMEKEDVIKSCNAVQEGIIEYLFLGYEVSEIAEKFGYAESKVRYHIDQVKLTVQDKLNQEQSLRKCA